MQDDLRSMVGWVLRIGVMRAQVLTIGVVMVRVWNIEIKKPMNEGSACLEFGDFGEVERADGEVDSDGARRRGGVFSIRFWGAG